MNVICSYCGQPARLVSGLIIYPYRDDLRQKKFWQCQPCDAYVGCHEAGNGYGDGTRPLGRLADASLRSAKQKAHEVFDRLWMNQVQRNAARKRAYKELALRMGIKVDDCHIGMFDVTQCQEARGHALKMILNWKAWNEQPPRHR